VYMIIDFKVDYDTVTYDSSYVERTLPPVLRMTLGIVTLTEVGVQRRISTRMAAHEKRLTEKRATEEFVRPRDAAVQLQISYPTVKQWIYNRKLRAVKTPGGHYRIPQSEVDRLLHRTRGHNEDERRVSYKRISGRNQLVGRIVDIRVSGLVAQVTLSVGGQLITSLITSGAVREMQLRKGQTAAALIKATEVMIIRV
jgi:molybdopterin-binding protein